MNKQDILKEFLSWKRAKDAEAELDMRMGEVRRLGGLNQVSLTGDEKQQIDEIWKPFESRLTKIDYRYWEMFKLMGTWNPLIVPDNLFLRSIIRTLNPGALYKTYQHKSLYPSLFPTLHQPETYVYRLNSGLYDASNNLITTDKAVKILQQRNRFIIKLVSDSCGGKGVRLVDIKEEGLGKPQLVELLKSYGQEYICQEPIRQSDIMAQFNPTSVNTYRINTVNLNGKITVENIMFRHGANGAVVDNIGSGGMSCGVSVDGRYLGLPLTVKWEKRDISPLGIPYTEIFIPEVASICETAIKAHRDYINCMGHGAWDFTLDENNNPMFVELNLGYPGIMNEQMVNQAPVYGNRTEEVLEYVKGHMHELRWEDFTRNWN